MAQDGTPQEKAEAFLKAMRDEERQGYPHPSPVIDADAFQYLLDHKLILELKNSDMGATYKHMQSVYDGVILNNSANEDGYFKTPIYVIPGIGEHKEGLSAFKIKTSNGEKDVIFTDEGNHIYGADYIHQYVQKSDADIAAEPDVVPAGQYTPSLLPEPHNGGFPTPSMPSTLTPASEVPIVPPSPETRLHYEQLLAAINTMAREQGIVPPAILIHTQYSDNLEAFESKEGHSYLPLNESQLQGVLTHYDHLNGYLDTLVKPQLERLKKQETSPDGLAFRKEVRQFKDNFSGEMKQLQIVFHLPAKNVPVRDAVIHDMIARGNLVALPRDELFLPSNMSEADKAVFATKDASGKDIPIYRADKMGIASSAMTPEVLLLKTKEGTPYILVSEGYHKWTEAYVSDKYLESERTLAGKINNKMVMPVEQYMDEATSAPGSLSLLQSAPQKKGHGTAGPYKPQEISDPAQEGRYNQLMEYVKDTADRMGIAVPPLLVSTSMVSGHHFGTAAAAMSQEGTNRVFIEEGEFRRDLASDEGLQYLKGTIGHEMAHIRDGDTTPFGIIRGRNLAVQRYEEERADLLGNSALGSGTPEAEAEWFKRGLREAIPAYLKQHAGETMSLDNPTDEDYKKVSQWEVRDGKSDHPADWDRIVALLQGKKIKDENPAMQPEEVVQKVMAYMQDNKLWTLPMEAPAGTHPLDTPGAYGRPSSPGQKH